MINIINIIWPPFIFLKLCISSLFIFLSCWCCISTYEYTSTFWCYFFTSSIAPMAITWLTISTNTTIHGIFIHMNCIDIVYLVSSQKKFLSIYIKIVLQISINCDMIFYFIVGIFLIFILNIDQIFILILWNL